jgi:predicted RNase H-like HicB family nuclease
MAEHALTITRRYDGYFVASFVDVPEVTACGRDSEEAVDEATKALRAFEDSNMRVDRFSQSHAARSLLIRGDED